MSYGATNRSQFRAAAFARSFLAHSVRKTFISAFNVAICEATPLYFFVMPVTVVSRLPPAALDRYLAAVPAMSRFPTAPFN
jgi:hypothetical protein